MRDGITFLVVISLLALLILRIRTTGLNRTLAEFKSLFAVLILRNKTEELNRTLAQFVYLLLSKCKYLLLTIYVILLCKNPVGEIGEF